jgi:phosphocarrier protein
LALGAKNGDTVTLEADGDGAAEALDAVASVVAEDHDDPA